MLYFGRAYKVWHKNTPRYHIQGIDLGDTDNKHSNLFIPIQWGIGRHLRGLRQDLTIRSTNSGNPRIDRISDTNMYLVLSALQTNPDLRHCCASGGYILAPPEQQNAMLGIQGDYAGIWHEAIIQAQPGDIFMVQPPTYKRKPVRTYYLVGKDSVIIAHDDEVKDAYYGLLRTLGQCRGCLSEGLQPWTWKDLCRPHQHHLTAHDFSEICVP